MPCGPGSATPPGPLGETELLPSDAPGSQGKPSSVSSQLGFFKAGSREKESVSPGAATNCQERYSLRLTCHRRAKRRAKGYSRSCFSGGLEKAGNIKGTYH